MTAWTWLAAAAAAVAGWLGPTAGRLGGCARVRSLARGPADRAARRKHRLREHLRDALAERSDPHGTAEVAALVSAVGVHLRAGASPVSALESALQEAAPGPTNRGLARVVELVHLGASPSGALASVGVGHRALGWLAACWRITEATGAPLAPVAERLANALREQLAHDRAVQAELAGARASARLLGALPLVGLAMGEALGAGPVHVLLWTPAGRGCLLTGVGLEWIGLRWSRAIVTAARHAR